MELWVRSQDKKRLTKIEDLYIVHSENDMCDYIGNNLVGHLAKYTKKERALEVLDEIENYIGSNGNTIIEQDAQCLNFVSNIKKVYQMPEE